MHYSSSDMSPETKILLSLAITILIFVIICASLLLKINSKLYDLRIIESESRNANWIMACNDIDLTVLPETFAACHDN